MSALLRLLLPFLLIFAITPAYSQTKSTTELSQDIAKAAAELRTADHDLNTNLDSDARTALRTSVLEAQQSIRASEKLLTDQLTLVDARITGMGPVTEGLEETQEIQAKRDSLAKEKADIDAAIKKSGLHIVEAQQLLDEIDRSQAAQLNETLSAQGQSPLSPSFWAALFKAMPRDISRIELFISQGVEQIKAYGPSSLPWQALLGTLLAFAFLFPIRLTLRHVGQRYLIGSAPGHRIRRSGFALWRIVVGTGTAFLSAFFLVQGMRWSGLFPERWDRLLDGMIIGATFASFIMALSGAIFMRKQPSWRIAELSDQTVARLQPAFPVLAIIAFFSIVLNAFNEAVGVSRATATTSQMTIALLHLVWIAGFLFMLGRLKSLHSDTQAPEDQPTTNPIIPIINLCMWVVVIATLAALALGFIELSYFVAQQIIWISVLSACLFLLLGAADDFVTAIFNRESPLGITLTRSVGLRASLVDQFGVIVSGTIRIFLILVTISLLMTPFGGGGALSSLFGHVGSIAQGIEVGGLSISPSAIIRSALVLAIGLALVRTFMNWLEEKFLPATDMDGSARNSASMIARYVGIALVIIWALASLGIGLERIALLLSALSVGIGFGLQAITQNFVSGLILLAERPIKIGDWVRVGTDEGDVKRISVRSTEITLADHSTLIVPNSELITKTVLNKTLSSPFGRMQIQFSVPLDTPVDTVIHIVHKAFKSESIILETPAPTAFIDSIANGSILFNCFAHVPSPRDVYRTRSNVFLTLLRQFAAEGIDISTVTQRLELHTPDEEAALHHKPNPSKHSKSDD